MTKLGKFLVAAVAAPLFLGPAPAPAGGHGEGYMMTPFESLEFQPLAEGSPVMIAVLWGDPMTGPSGFLLRLPAGFEAPMHTHTASYRAVVVDGEALHWIEGEDKAMAASLGEGGYWLQPGGQAHGDANPGDSPSLSLVIFDGPFDFVAAE